MRRGGGLLLLALAACGGAAGRERKEPSAPVVSPARLAAAPLPPPAFDDPARARKIEELVPKLAAIVDGFYAQEKPASVAVAFVVDGRVAMTRVLGVRDRATNAPATPRTLYRIGSITKTFTASAVLALRDEGKLRLDVPAETYLPELARVEYPFADAPKITLRHLLTHTSGLPRLGAFDYTSEVDVTEKAMLDAVPKAHVGSAPGTTYLYSNFGVSLVGLIVGRASPTGTLRGEIARTITTPLGMNDTTFAPRAGAETATPYTKASDPKPAKLWHLGASEGSGGLWSSLDDMSKWVAFELSAWPARAEPERGPLARRTLREMQIAGFPIEMEARVEQGHVKAKSGGIGFAWHTHTSCAYESIVEHGGAIDGFHAAVGFAPERGFGFVVLANALDANTGRLQDELFDAAADVLGPRVQQPDPMLVEMVRRLVPTLATCEQAPYDTMFDEAFRGAVSKKTYTSVCEELRSAHGTCVYGGVLSVTDPRNAEFLWKCERGTIDAHASITIDDDGKARFDTFRVEGGGLPLAPELAKTMDELLALLVTWDSAKYQVLFATTDHEAQLRAAYEKVHAGTGACKRVDNAPTLGGDGTHHARVALTCERGGASDLVVTTNAAGKVESVYFKPHESAAPSKPQRCR